MITTLLLYSAIGFAAAQEGMSNRFQSFQSVLGPVGINREQSLKVCASDISVVTKMGAQEEEDTLARRSYGTPVVWSSTRIAVYDSRELNKPLPADIPDIIFASGKGECVSLLGRDIGTDDATRSIVVVLTTLTEAKAVFDPMVSGQLAAPNATSGITLIVPAIQSAGSGGSSAACCACVPVCGCGICDN